MFIQDNGCKYHPPFRLQYFCLNDNCMEKVCDICVLDSHQHHNVQNFYHLSLTLKSHARKRQAEVNLYTTELKSILGELESIGKRVMVKYKKLKFEEKKLEEDFEKRSRKWLTIIQEKNSKLQKKIAKLKTKVSTTKGVSNVEDEVVNLVESNNEDIKKLLKKHDSDTLKLPSCLELKNELTQITEEANSFDLIDLQSIQNEVFLNSNGVIQLNTSANKKTSNRSTRFSPVLQQTRFINHDKHGLRIAIPETPAEALLIAKSRNESFNLTSTIPRTCKEPIKDRRGELEDYMIQIAMKKSEIERLEKVREKLLNTNKELQQQIAKQNHALISNIDLLSPTPGYISSPQMYTTLRNGMFPIKSLKSQAPIKKDRGREKLKTLINKLNQTCEEWSNVPTPDSSIERKVEVKTPSLQPIDHTVKRKTELKVVSLETTISDLKKELGACKSLLNISKANCEKEKERAKEFEAQKDKIMNELKALKDNYMKLKNPS